MAETGAVIWRDYETDGVPSSGAHEPKKSEIRAWAAVIEALGGLEETEFSVPLFSVPGDVPAYRFILGRDLPTPADDELGGLFSFEATATSVVSGLDGDGNFTFRSVTGTGDVVFSDDPTLDSPNITTGIFLSSNLFAARHVAGDTFHSLYAPGAGREAIQLDGTFSKNLYNADTHSFFSGDGSVPFGNWGAGGMAFNGSISGAAQLKAAAVAGTPVITLPLLTGNVLGSAGQQTLAGGFNVTITDAGTKSSGTFTPAPLTNNLQKFVNGGAFTLAPPASDCSMVLQGTNNGSAGTITTSGFTKVTGDALTTTNGDDFMFYIVVLNSFSHLHVQALQ